MKKIIRNWLGIKEPVQIKERSRAEMRREIAELIVDLMENKPDFVGDMMFYPRWEMAKNSLVCSVRDGLAEETRKAVDARAAELVGGEAFIDGVIDRINRKQIGRATS